MVATQIRALVAIGIAVAVVIASIGLLLWGMPAHQNSLQPNAPGLQALAAVEGLLPKIPGANWSLLSAIGIASSGPYSPFPTTSRGGAGAEWQYWECAALPMPTIWNSSGIPVRGGNLSDGLAPFWQFIFVSNSSVESPVFDFTTFVAGQVQISDPVPSTNDCIMSIGLSSLNYSTWSASPSIETTTASSYVYQAASPYIGQIGDDYAVIWTAGYPILSTLGWGNSAYVGNSAWLADYYTCGVPYLGHGISSPIAIPVSVWSTNGTPTVNPLGFFSANCTLSNYEISGTPGPRVDAQSSPTNRYEISVNSSSNSEFPSNVSFAQGVASWMVVPVVTSTNGTMIPASTDLCSSWVQNVSRCPIPEAGWYVVLASPSGSWMGSYGNQGLSPAWSVINTPIVTGVEVYLFSASFDGGFNASVAFESQIQYPAITCSSMPVGIGP